MTTTTAPATEIVRLNPRTSNGSLAAGWITTPEAIEQCATGGERSSYSLTADVFTCGPNAAARRACWAMNDGTAVCLHTADSRQLAKFPIQLPVQVTASTAPHTPAALAFELADGGRCEVVTHAGPAQRADNGFGRYECTDGRVVLEDGLGGKVVDKSKPQWTVRVARDLHPAKTITVKRAWFADSTPFTPKAPTLNQEQTANAFLRAIGSGDDQRAAVYGTKAAIAGARFGGPIDNVVYGTCAPQGGTPWKCVSRVGQHQTDNVWDAVLTVAQVNGTWKVSSYVPRPVDMGVLAH